MTHNRIIANMNHQTGRVAIHDVFDAPGPPRLELTRGDAFELWEQLGALLFPGGYAVRIPPGLSEK